MFHNPFRLAAKGIQHDRSLALSFVTFLTLMCWPALTYGGIIQHLGAEDPQTEGWTFNVAGESPNIIVGPVLNDVGSGFDAWQVDDNSVNALGSYTASLTSNEFAQASQQGWVLTSLLRVVDIPDPAPGASRGIVNDASPSLIYRDKTTTWQVHFETESNGDLFAFLMTDVIRPGRTGISVPVSGGATSYHMFELRFDPSESNADFFIDSALMLSDYSGAPLTTSDAFVYWGAGTGPAEGHANYNLVRFQAIPEPSSLLTLGIGFASLSLFALRRRKAGCR